MSFKVFLSHSVADLNLVYQLRSWLEMYGVETHVAEFSPQPGTVLADKVAAAIEASDCLIAILTRDGARSQWVHEEIGWAKGQGKLIIPLVEEGVDVKGFIEGLEYIEFSWQYPEQAIDRVSQYVTHLAQRKLNQEGKTIAVAGILLALGLLGLVAAAHQEKALAARK